MKKIKFTINNKEYFAKKGETVLDAAKREKIEIPHLCKHPDLKIKGNCRMCLVEANGQITTACSTEVLSGMTVKTNTKEVERGRKINLELIFSEHIEKCPTCIYQDNCIILKYAAQYGSPRFDPLRGEAGNRVEAGVKIARFEDRKKDYPVWQFSDSIQFDSSKCIDCRNCEEVCREKQACSFYEITNDKGEDQIIKPKGETRDKRQETRDMGGVDLLKNDSDKFDCTYCGQCVTHCPVGAIAGVEHWQAVEKLLQNKGDKILVAEIAPSIRVSIGEEFGQDYGKIMTGQLAASMKALGFDYAFDVNLGADFTTYEEARELVKWLSEDKPRPMFTSCCPAWVKFVEFFYPEFISHLTTSNSPHMCSGPVIKTFFADYLKKDPRDIEIVSIMPCTSKKHEIGLEKHKIDLGWCLERLDLPNIQNVCQSRGGLAGVKVPAVDYVLTTREYAFLLHRHKIDLPNLKPIDLDLPLGVSSGAGAIYGASGGVMESALRSADYFLRVLDETGSMDSIVKGENYKLKKKRFSKISQSRIEFKEARGQQGIKTARVKVGGRKLNIAVVNGLGNAKKILEDLKAGRVKYDYVEVMACPGGCIGGGGQPIPTNAEIRAKRAAAVYEIDKNLPVRTAHENPSVLEVYNKYFKGDEELIEHVLHSRFKVREREGYKEIKI